MNLIYDFSLISLFFSIVLFFSIGLWFLNRKQRKIIYYPILKILDKIPKTYPKIIFKKPPFLPVFVLFCLGLILLLISFKPSVVSFKKSKEPGKKIHIVVDNSASMQGSINKEDLSILVSKLATRLSSVNVVTLSLSNSYDVYKYRDMDGFLENLKSSDFSRKGFRLGHYISKIMRIISETDQVVLVSDGDKYSWDDFDWKV